MCALQVQVCFVALAPMLMRSTNRAADTWVGCGRGSVLVAPMSTDPPTVVLTPGVAAAAAFPVAAAG